MDGRHIGFADGGMGDVVWTATTFVKQVHPSDERPIQRLERFLAVCGISSFVLAAILLFGAGPLGRIAAADDATWFYIVGGIFVALAITQGATMNILMRSFAIRQIGSRSEKLFAVDGDCLFVRIESPLTYNRFKLAAEEMGLLKITPEYLQFEMTRHRAQVETQHVKVSLMRVSKNIAGVHLRYDCEPAAWAVVIAGAVSGQGDTGGTSADRAMRLLALLRDAGAEVTEEKGRV